MVTTNISTVGSLVKTGTNDTEDLTGVTLTDTSEDFVITDRIQVGQTITNTTSSDTGIITAVTPTTIVCAAGLSGGGDGNWDTGDGYSISRHYVDVDAWADGTEGNLVTAETIEVAEVYNDSRLIENVVLENSTTNALYYRIVRAAPGEGHDGTFSGAGATISSNSGGLPIITVLDAFAQVGEGLLLELLDGVTDSAECVRFGNDANNAEGSLVEKALLNNEDATGNIDGVYAGNWDVGTAANPVTVRNVMIKGMTRIGVHPQAHGAGQTHTHHWNVVSVTIVDCTTAGIFVNVQSATTTVNIKIIDVLLGDNTLDYDSSGAGVIVTTGSEKNWDEDNLVPGAHASNPMTLVTTPVSGVEAVIVNKYDDLTLVDDVDNDVLDTGVGPATNPLVPLDDIVGNPRAGTTTDPGAFQVSVITTISNIVLTKVGS